MFTIGDGSAATESLQCSPNEQRFAYKIKVGRAGLEPATEGL